MSDAAERCATCRFWELLPKAHQEPDAGGLLGLCHRFPPTLQPHEAISFEAASSPDAWILPTTWNDFWCGEWQARPRAEGNHP
jgi:hypothetical protein